MATEIDDRPSASSTTASSRSTTASSPPRRPPMAKWWCTELQKRTVDTCLQLHGGYGYMLEYPIARAYVDARITDDLRRHHRDHEGDHRPRHGRLARSLVGQRSEDRRSAGSGDHRAFIARKRAWKSAGALSGHQPRPRSEVPPSGRSVGAGAEAIWVPPIGTSGTAARGSSPAEWSWTRRPSIPSASVRTRFDRSIQLAAATSITNWQNSNWVISRPRRCAAAICGSTAAASTCSTTTPTMCWGIA